MRKSLARDRAYKPLENEFTPNEITCVIGQRHDKEITVIFNQKEIWGVGMGYM